MIKISESERLRIREKALSDHYFFNKAILGFDKLTDLHKEVSAFVCDHSKSKKKMVLLPRKHYKTTHITIGYTLWRICRDPNITILICNEKDENVYEWIIKMELHLTANDLLRTVFPELMPDGFKPQTWSQSAFTVNRTILSGAPTVQGAGVKSAVTSKHRDLIIEDDLVSKAAIDCPDTMRKAFEFHQLLESCFDEDIGEGEELVVGTRWDRSDVYGWILKREPEFEVYSREVIENGKPILPGAGFTLERIAKLKNRLGSYFFGCQMTNRPCDREDIILREDWLRYHDIDEDGNVVIQEDGKTEKIAKHEFDIVLIGDTSHSETNLKRLKYSKSAATVLGVDKKERVFLFDHWAKRGEIRELIEQIFIFNKIWRPRMIGIEAVGFQRYLKTDIEREAKVRKVHLNIKPLYPKGREDKISRIKLMIPYCERGAFFIPKYKDNNPFFDEYGAFPNEHISLDILDTIGYGIRELYVPDAYAEWMEGQHDREVLSEMNEYTGY